MNLFSVIFEKYVSHPGLKSIVSDQAFINRMIRFEIALAACQARLGIITGDAAEAIQRVLKDVVIKPSELVEGTMSDGVPTVAFLKLCREQLAPEHRNSLHYGATSQDVIDTATALMMKESAVVMEESITEILAALEDMLEKFGDVRCMMRTRHQLALPGVFNRKVKAWRDPLVRQLDKLKSLGPDVFKIQLGGPVGDGQTMGSQQGKLVSKLARALELAAAPPWHDERDSICAFTGWLATTAGILGKLGSDLMVMARDEVSEVTLSAQGFGASSSMPHKHNPVRCEALIAIARLTANQQAQMLQALVHESQRDGSTLIQEWYTLPQMILLTGSALDHGQALLKEAIIRTDVMEQNVSEFLKNRSKPRT